MYDESCMCLVMYSIEVTSKQAISAKLLSFFFSKECVSERQRQDNINNRSIGNGGSLGN